MITPALAGYTKYVSNRVCVADMQISHELHSSDSLILARRTLKYLRWWFRCLRSVDTDRANMLDRNMLTQVTMCLANDVCMLIHKLCFSASDYGLGWNWRYMKYFYCITHNCIVTPRAHPIPQNMYNGQVGQLPKFATWHLTTPRNLRTQGIRIEQLSIIYRADLR